MRRVHDPTIHLNPRTARYRASFAVRLNPHSMCLQNRPAAAAKRSKIVVLRIKLVLVDGAVSVGIIIFQVCIHAVWM